MNIKETAEVLLKRAIEEHIRFPKTWTESQKRQSVGAAMMLRKTGDEFDHDSIINDLIEKYGKDSGSKLKEKDDDKNIEVVKEDDDAPVKTNGKRASKRKLKSDDASDNEEKGEIKKKKVDEIGSEDNRGIAEAIREMAGLYFKNKDPRKGGVFSKAAKAIRECPTPISNKKEAKALKGVGDKIAEYIEEYLSSGMIEKLEELRAGTA